MRLFVAIELPAGLRAELGQRVEAIRRRLPPARWVPPANLHLTLRFLGETLPEARPTLERALAAAFGAQPPFRARLDGAGAFPPRAPARVLWVGVEDPEPLTTLQAAVERSLGEALGLAPEARPYHPHLTLARCRRPWPRAAVERWREGFSPPETGEFAVDRGTLFRSTLAPGGATYEALASFGFEEG